MKHAVLHSLAHNLADSLGSGCSLLTGFFGLDLFAELRTSVGDEITIDFLTGKLRATRPSALLQKAAGQAPLALKHLCYQHGCGLEEFRFASARFWQDATAPLPGWGTNHRFDVTIEDRRGRRSTMEYFGWPGKRLLVRDALGRLRRKPPVMTAKRPATPPPPARP